MARRPRACGQWVVGIALCLAASGAWGQEPPPRGAGTQVPGTETEPAPGPPIPARPIAAYPLELLGLIAPPAQRGPLTLTPSIGISAEYNDNVLSDNRNRQWDLITTFSPTIVLSVNRPSFRLNVGYSFSAALYAEETSRNNALDNQNFIADGDYQVTPGLTLTASDSFAYNNNTNVVAVQGFSTGRQKSWSNTFGPGMTWRMTPQNSLSLGATYSVLRFEGTGAGLESDTYGFRSSLGHAFTPRLTGNVGYDFTYLDFHGQGTSTTQTPQGTSTTQTLQGQGSSTTHSPTVGLSYQLTQTLTGAINGGAAITEVAGKTAVTPAGSLTLAQALRFGSASLSYTRNVGVAGGFGGTADTQTAAGTLTLSSLQRGLVVAFSPTYSIAESVSSQQANQVDVKTLTVSLNAAYQVGRFVRVFAGYTFLHQRTGGSSATQIDVDQNRVRVGVQLGYPFSFD